MIRVAEAFAINQVGSSRMEVRGSGERGAASCWWGVPPETSEAEALQLSLAGRLVKGDPTCALNISLCCLLYGG